MSWVVLIVSGAFEAVWAVALGKSEGFTRLWPSVIFFSALIISMGGLGWALREIPTGTGYTVWVGVGASIAVAYGFITGDEHFSWIKILLLMGLIGCIMGLRLVSES